MVREPRFECPNTSKKMFLGSQPWQGQIITTKLLAHLAQKTEQSFIYLSQVNFIVLS